MATIKILTDDLNRVVWTLRPISDLEIENLSEDKKQNVVELYGQSLGQGFTITSTPFSLENYSPSGNYFLKTNKIYAILEKIIEWINGNTPGERVIFQNCEPFYASYKKYQLKEDGTETPKVSIGSNFSSQAGTDTIKYVFPIGDEATAPINNDYIYISDSEAKYYEIIYKNLDDSIYKRFYGEVSDVSYHTVIKDKIFENQKGWTLTPNVIESVTEEIDTDWTNFSETDGLIRYVYPTSYAYAVYDTSTLTIHIIKSFNPEATATNIIGVDGRDYSNANNRIKLLKNDSVLLDMALYATKVIFDYPIQWPEDWEQECIWFMGLYNLTSIDNLSNFDISNMQSMFRMFLNCSSLQTIDVSHFNTSKVTNMASMFDGCRALQEINVSNFDTSNVIYMSQMFSKCSNLTSLNLSNFDTSNVTDMSGMFSTCGLLKTITVNPSSWYTSIVTNSDSMFDSCTALVGEEGTIFDANHVDKTYARIDNPPSEPGYLSSI